MNWIIPVICPILIVVLFFVTKAILHSGSVERAGMRFTREKAPATYWAFVVLHIFWIVAAALVLILWTIDFNGMRSG